MTANSIGLVAFAYGLAMVGTPAFAADYEHMMAMSTMRIPDMVAGPAGTGALISTDGTRILHIGASNTCVLDLAESGSWERTICRQLPFEEKPRYGEDMLWSPKGEWLLMPTYGEAIFELRDTDVRLFDPNALTVTNLTNDDFADGFMERSTGSAYLDIAPRWVDEDTIAFIRYPVPKEGLQEWSAPLLMTVDATGGEPQQLFKPLAPEGVLITTLAVSSDGQHFAFTIDPRDEVKGAGLYTIDRAEGGPRRILTASEVGEPATGIAFSADGRYLLLLSPFDAGVDARVVDLETGAVTPVGDGRTVAGVAWSPTDAALAYVVDDGDAEDHQGGLYLSPAPGEPGEMLVRGRFMPPICCGRQPISWANDNTILLGRIEDMETVLEVKLGP